LATLVADVSIALQNGARAGAAAASSAGRDLGQDIEAFLVPHLKDIAAQVVSIIQKRNEGIYTDATTKDLLAFGSRRGEGAFRNDDNTCRI